MVILLSLRKKMYSNLFHKEIVNSTCQSTAVVRAIKSVFTLLCKTTVKELIPAEYITQLQRFLFIRGQGAYGIHGMKH